MLLRIHRDARCLAQIQIRWKLQEIGNRFEGNLRDLLWSQVIAERGSSAKYNGEGPIARHDSLLMYRELQYQIPGAAAITATGASPRCRLEHLSPFRRPSLVLARMGRGPIYP